jgi:hypothetical protein
MRRLKLPGTPRGRFSKRPGANVRFGKSKFISSPDVTGQTKIINVNDKFGNTGIKKQQGSTVILYDSLKLDGTTLLQFFREGAQHPFPLSNVGSDGNKLGVGNSMVIERAYFSIVKIESGVVTSILPLTLAATDPGILAGQFNFSVANSEVIKKLPLLSWLPQFNKLAENEVNTSFDFDSLVTIPPLLEFQANVELSTYRSIPDTYLRLTIEGAGAIIAPRTTF